VSFAWRQINSSTTNFRNKSECDLSVIGCQTVPTQGCRTKSLSLSPNLFSSLNWLIGQLPNGPINQYWESVLIRNE
jgi:hypothetical protein